MRKTLTICCMLLIIAISAFTQDHLKIEDIFDKYGKQEGSTLVLLSSDVLSQGSNMTLYKSLIMDESTEKEQETLNAIKADTKDKIILSEVNKNGWIVSRSYYLGSNKSSVNDFILYRKKGDKITLVYVKGKFPSNQLEHELKKLKDLFIYVNNKRIKLQ